MLQLLYQRDDFVLENLEQFSSALTLFKTGNADFSDYLIFSNSQENKLAFYTFDKKLARTDGVIRLTGDVVDDYP